MSHNVVWGTSRLWATNLPAGFFPSGQFRLLKHLDFANPSDGSSHLDVNILTGSYLYWQLVASETRCRNPGPVGVKPYLAGCCQDQFPPLHLMCLPLALSRTLCVSMGHAHSMCRSVTLKCATLGHSTQVILGAGVIGNSTQRLFCLWWLQKLSSFH